jgi:hypothetical protein
MQYFYHNVKNQGSLNCNTKQKQFSSIGADIVHGVSALFFQQSYKSAYSNLLMKAVAVPLFCCHSSMYCTVTFYFSAQKCRDIPG